MRRQWLIGVILGVSVLAASASMYGCMSTPARTAPRRSSSDASVTLPPSLSISRDNPSNGQAVLSVHVNPLSASVNETIAATVTYSNPGTDTAFVGENGPLYNLKVTSSEGHIVFDTASGQASLYPVFWGGVWDVVAPGEKLHQVIPFKLTAPDRYSVVAYSYENGGPWTTPPVVVTVIR